MLYTEIVVFFMMITFGGISYLIYNVKDTLRTSQIAFVGYIGFLAISVLIFKGYIYSSNTLLSIPKSMIVFLGEQTFIFAIFMLFVNFLKYGEDYLFIGHQKSILIIKYINILYFLQFFY